MTKKELRVQDTLRREVGREVEGKVKEGDGVNLQSRNQEEDENGVPGW